MNYESTPSSLRSETLYAAFFEALPGNSVLVANDAPKFTILATTPAFLAQTGYTREAMIGKGVFEAFPASTDPDYKGDIELLTSYQHVLLHKEPHYLPAQRYDLKNDDGSFTEKYWKISNAPVFSQDGAVAFIIHTSEDITNHLQEGKMRDRVKGMKPAYNLYMQTPVPVCILKGPALVVELANEPTLQLWGRTEEVIGMALGEAIPELKGQVYLDLINEVRRTGKTNQVYESPVTLIRNGKQEVLYVNYVYEPYYDEGKSEAVGVLAIGTDVTEKVLAKIELKESQERFRLMADAAPNLVWMLNADGSYKLVNKTTLEFLGVSLEEIDKVGWLPFLHPDEKEDVSNAVNEAVEKRKPYKKEHRLRTKDGEYRWVLSQAIPAFDANGSVYAYVGSGIDIHDRKKAESSLEESEAKFRIMAENTPVLIAVGDETGNVTYFNKAWTEMTGRPMQQLIQLGWVDLVHPDDKEQYESIYLRDFAVKSPFTGEFRVVNKHGEYRWLLIHAVARFSTDGLFAGTISTCTDITDQKSSQQQLETALEQIRLSKQAAELGTFDMDLENGTMHWDDRCRTLFGISHHKPVSYENDFVPGLHPDDRERILKVIDQLFNKSISNGDYDVEYRTLGAEDRILRWVRAKGKVYYNEEDKPVRFIGSVLDISEKVTAIQKIESLVEERTKELAEANENLQNINKELQRSNQNLEEFAHAASHDLKEPVRKIHFYTDQLKAQLGKQLQESQANALSRIQHATERMGNLIDDLLLYSHVSQRPHQMESVDLNEKLQRVLDDLDLDIEEKKAVIHVETLPLVKGYRRQLQQLFQNLISNALKYSKPDVPPRIDIKASELTENGLHYHMIEVRDNGIGFEEQYSEKIFQMFSRLHAKGKYSGTGVGLSIAKKVVENHNGFIKVKSAPGEGASFKVLLPMTNTG